MSGALAGSSSRVAKIGCFLLLIGAGLALNATSARAGVCSTGADVSWIGVGGGSWNDTANWDTGALPQPNDNVCIDPSLSGTVAFPSGSITVNELDMPDNDVTLELNGGFFGIAADSSVGNVHLFSETATLQVDSTLEVRDEFAWRRGTLQGAGTTKAFDVRIWSTEPPDAGPGHPRYLDGHTLSMSGPGSTWGQWGDIIGLGGGTISNSGTLTIIQGDGDILRDVGVTDRINLVNSGTIVKDEGGSTGSPDTNSFWDVDATFHMGSDLQIETRTITFAGPSSFAGEIDLDAMPSSGQLTFAASGAGVTHQLTGDSTLETHHGGVVRFEGGTTTIAGAYDSWITEITGAGSAEFTNELSPATIHFLSLGANGVLGGDARIDIDNPGGNFSWTGGTIQGSGDVDVTGASSDIEGASPKILNGRNVILDGDVDWGNPLDPDDPNGDIVMGDGGDLRIEGRLFIRSDADITSSGIGPAPTLVNNGLIVKTAGATDGSNETRIGVFVSHFGTNLGEGIDANIGTLELGAGGSILGPMSANGTAMLDLSGGIFDLGPASAVTGAGVVSVRGADVYITGVWDVSGETRITDGMLKTFVGADAQTNELDMDGGTLDSSAAVNFLTTGPASLTGGEIAGGVWEFDDDLAFDGLHAFQVTGGTVQMDGNTDWLSGDIHTADANFIVGPDGTFDILGDDDLQYNGSGSLSDFVNNGTVVKSAGLDGESTNVDGVVFQNDALAPDGWRIEDGIMRIGAGGSSSGALSVSAGAVLDLAGAVFAIDGATTGTGTVEASAGNVTIGDDEVVPFDFPGTVKLTGGVFEAVSPASTSIMDIQSGTLSGAATMTVEDELEWSGGSMIGSGQTVLQDAGPDFEGEISDNVELFGRTFVIEGNLIWGGGDIDTGTEGGTIRTPGSFLMGGDAGDILYAGTGDGPLIDTDGGTILSSAIDGQRDIQGTLKNTTGHIQAQYGVTTFNDNFDHDDVTDTLSGGRYDVFSEDEFPTAIEWGAPVVHNAATIYLEGPDSWIGISEQDALCNNTSSGVLTLFPDELGGRVLACPTGAFTNAGEIDMYDQNSISATGGFIQAATGDLWIQLDTPTSGEFVSAGGAILLDGTLNVDLAFTPTDSFSVVLMTGGPTSGAFDDVVVDGLPTGWRSAIEVTSGEVRLNVDPPTITLGSSAATRTFGQPFTLAGKIISSEQACVDAVPVRITRDPLGGAVAFSTVAVVTTDADGDYTLSRKADRSATYKATVDGTGECAAAEATKLVSVKKKVTLKAPRKVAKGTIAKLKVIVAPCSGHQRKKVTLQRKTASGFKKVATKATNAKCVAVFKVRMKKARVFRAVAPKTDADHLAGISRTKKVRAV